jgi:hypothetical protein
MGYLFAALNSGLFFFVLFSQRDCPRFEKHIQTLNNPLKKKERKKGGRTLGHIILSHLFFPFQSPSIYSINQRGELETSVRPREERERERERKKATSRDAQKSAAAVVRFWARDYYDSIHPFFVRCVSPPRNDG